MSTPQVFARNGMVRVGADDITPTRARQLAIDLIVAAFQAELDRIRMAADDTTGTFEELIDEVLNAPGAGAAAVDAYLASQEPYTGPRGIIAALGAVSGSYAHDYYCNTNHEAGPDPCPRVRLK